MMPPCAGEVHAAPIGTAPEESTPSTIMVLTRRGNVGIVQRSNVEVGA
jgi:hypothetical protein